MDLQLHRRVPVKICASSGVFLCWEVHGTMIASSGYQANLQPINFYCGQFELGLGRT